MTSFTDTNALLEKLDYHRSTRIDGTLMDGVQVLLCLKVRPQVGACSYQTRERWQVLYIQRLTLLAAFRPASVSASACSYHQMRERWHATFCSTAALRRPVCVYMCSRGWHVQNPEEHSRVVSAPELRGDSLPPTREDSLPL